MPRIWRKTLMLKEGYSSDMIIIEIFEKWNSLQMVHNKYQVKIALRCWISYWDFFGEFKYLTHITCTYVCIVDTLLFYCQPGTWSRILGGSQQPWCEIRSRRWQWRRLDDNTWSNLELIFCIIALLEIKHCFSLKRHQNLQKSLIQRDILVRQRISIFEVIRPMIDHFMPN